MRRLSRLAFVCLGALLSLPACASVPEMPPHERREFKRAPALLDTAVLGSEVIAGAEVKKYENGDPVDYIGHHGKRIRVTYDPKKGVTVLMVTHRGFGGPKGAQRVLDQVEAWIKDTDKAVRRKGASGRRKRPPLPTKEAW